MKTDQAVLDAFDKIRRAQRAGVYAPHKPLLILLFLARVQQQKVRLAEFAEIDEPMKRLLAEFGPSSAPNSRHYPFWHLGTDNQGALWEVSGPREVLARPAAATPTLGELRAGHVKGGFATNVDSALRHSPALLRTVARRVLAAYFPETLHADIAGAVGLDLSSAHAAREESEDIGACASGSQRRRDARFREKVLLAYEYRCCVCGFDLRIAHMPAGLEAAHIKWHHVGGPDIEPNGLSLCALHHKLFDLGVFTIEESEHRIVFSQHAIGGASGENGGLQFHGQRLRLPQQRDAHPAAEFLAWNAANVFKRPSRQLTEAPAKPREAR